MVRSARELPHTEKRKMQASRLKNPGLCVFRWRWTTCKGVKVAVGSKRNSLGRAYDSVYRKLRSDLETDCIVIGWERRNELATVITWSVAYGKVESRRFLHVFSQTFLAFDLYGRVKFESVFPKLLKFLAVCFEW